MTFNSIEFLVFLPAVLFVYFVLPGKIKNIWLLIASYYFYMCWNAQYVLLIFASTVITYLSGILMERVKQCKYEKAKETRIKKLIVAVSLITNLGILFFFKYFNFAMESAAWLLGQFNISLNIPSVDILLPVGISFYTFQALSYTLDVYRDEIYAENNFFEYALFVSFFPQLVAGPIERSKNLLRQLAVPHRFNFEKARDGILLMLWGFFLKLVIADRIAVLVDTVYGNINKFPGYYLAVATVMFAVQIYCDFCGYSTIAMGAAKILGISLMDNFDAPYLSLSVAEFWRKWHISLTSWFKDYLYIPLGGSRKGKLRKYMNKMIVFLVSGLWHGANMSFLAWGGLNGIYQVIGDASKPARDKAVKMLGLHRETIGHKLFQSINTFLLIDFSWIFFRAQSLPEAVRIIKSIFTENNLWILFDDSLYKCGLDAKNFHLVIGAVFVLLVVDFCKHRNIPVMDIIARQDGWFKCLIVIIAVCIIIFFGKYGPAFDKTSFIYFQF